MEKSDLTHFEPLDIDHVNNKYQLGENYKYLVERLGKANTKRLHLLKYYKEHHERIVGRPVAMDEITGSKPEEAIEPNEDDYHMSEVSPTLYTDISTVRETNYGCFDAPHDDSDSQSEAGGSEASYASTVGTDIIRILDPPASFGVTPFQCPYCFRIIIAKNRASWK
jgi:hypothetical protein